MKKVLITLLVLILIGLGVWFFVGESSLTFFGGNGEETDGEEQMDEDEDGEETITEESPQTLLGTSAGGNDLIAYHYPPLNADEGRDTEILLVGGIHGGYSWNTALVAHEAMEWFESNPSVIPDNVQVTVIPVLNPDGLEKVVGTTGAFSAGDVTTEDTVPGRFNANNVDLNRNFDCDWQSVGVWQDNEVDGGTAAFSEPESAAFRDYVEANNPDAVVVWYSAVGGVFASNCHNGVLDETLELTNVFADASGYQAYEEFNFYEITGDAVNWLARIGVPGISVLLTTHEDVEWDKNRAGIEALLEYYEN